jgi:hypothetical protein
VQWALLAIATIAAVELVLRLGIGDTIRRLLTVVRKVLRIMKSDTISDHWKERAMLAYSGQMLSASLMLLAMLLLAVAPFAILAAVGTWIDMPMLALLVSGTGVLVSIAIACAYLPLRRRLKHV